MLVGAPITGHESRKRDGRMGRIVNICNSQKMSRYSCVDVQVLKSVREFGWVMGDICHTLFATKKILL